MLKENNLLNKKRRKITIINIGLVVISILGVIIASGLTSQIGVDSINHTKTVTIFNEQQIKMDVPPVVTEVRIHSLSSNEELVNFSIMISYSCYSQDYYYQLLPGGCLSTATNFSHDGGSLTSHLNYYSHFYVHFYNTSSPSEISIDIIGRTKTIPEMLVNGTYRQLVGMGVLIILLLIFLPSLILSIYLFFLTSTYNIIKLAKAYRKKQKVHFLPIFSSILPIATLILISSWYVLSFYSPLFVAVYYLVYVFFRFFKRHYLNEFYLWFCIGFTEILISTYMYVDFKPLVSVVLNETTVYPAHSTLPFILYFFGFGVIAVALSIRLSRFKLDESVIETLKCDECGKFQKNEIWSYSKFNRTRNYCSYRCHAVSERNLYFYTLLLLFISVFFLPPCFHILYTIVRTIFILNLNELYYASAWLVLGFTMTLVLFYPIIFIYSVITLLVGILFYLKRTILNDKIKGKF